VEIPCWAAGWAEGHGVPSATSGQALRLRGSFASRSRHFAKDDRGLGELDHGYFTGPMTHAFRLRPYTTASTAKLNTSNSSAVSFAAA